MPVRIIRHRVNFINDATLLAHGLGAEIDVRSSANGLYLAHDPFSTGPDLADFLDIWTNGTPRGTLILNPKEDGLEGMLTREMARREIHDFFLLDLPMPTIVRELSAKNRHVAIRVSEYEPVSAALAFSGMSDWAWLDSFSGRPPTQHDCEALISAGFRVCLVSPELQGHPVDLIDNFIHLAAFVDAVCTKFPYAWEVRNS